MAKKERVLVTLLADWTEECVADCEQVCDYCLRVVLKKPSAGEVWVEKDSEGWK